jgi:hypothetical protein
MAAMPLASGSAASVPDDTAQHSTAGTFTRITRVLVCCVLCPPKASHQLCGPRAGCQCQSQHLCACRETGSSTACTQTQTLTLTATHKSGLLAVSPSGARRVTLFVCMLRAAAGTRPTPQLLPFDSLPHLPPGYCPASGCPPPPLNPQPPTPGCCPETGLAHPQAPLASVPAPPVRGCCCSGCSAQHHSPLLHLRWARRSGVWSGTVSDGGARLLPGHCCCVS